MNQAAKASGFSQHEKLGDASLLSFHCLMKAIAMRLHVLPMLVLLFCLLAMHPHAFSQEGKADSPRTFLVTIVEARLSEQNTQPEATAEILWTAARDSSKVDWNETLRCTALERQKTSVFFGRIVSIVTGITESQRGQTRNLSKESMGTRVTLGIEAAGDKVAITIDYQASRLSGENNGELPPPETQTTNYVSSVVLELGKPKLLASTPISCLLVMIDEEQ